MITGSCSVGWLFRLSLRWWGIDHCLSLLTPRMCELSLLTCVSFPPHICRLFLLECTSLTPRVYLLLHRRVTWSHLWVSRTKLYGTYLFELCSPFDALVILWFSSMSNFTITDSSLTVRSNLDAKWWPVGFNIKLSQLTNPIKIYINTYQQLKNG